jgi:hypothetical protein
VQRVQEMVIWLVELLVRLLVPEPRLNQLREPKASSTPRFCKPLLLEVVK